MKKLILAITLAATFNASAITSEEMATCNTFADSARTTMKARQKGIELSRILAVNPGVTKPENYFTLGLILGAYDAPLFSVKANKDTATKSYANKWLMKCLKTFK